MFSEVEYQAVWLIYLAAAACCWLVWTQLTRWISYWFIREPLWLLMAVILFTPAQIDPLKPELAPAAIGWVLDTVLGTGGDASSLLSQLALAMALAILAYIGFACLRQGWRYWRSSGGKSAA